MGARGLRALASKAPSCGEAEVTFLPGIQVTFSALLPSLSVDLPLSFLWGSVMRARASPWVTQPAGSFLRPTHPPLGLGSAPHPHPVLSMEQVQAPGHRLTGP